MSKKNDRAVIALGDKVLVLQHPKKETREQTMTRAEELAATLYVEDVS